jgi:hypothetical protein
MAEPGTAPADPPAARAERPPHRRLTKAEQLVCAGAAITVASLILPWYGVRFDSRFMVSGIDAFGFAAAALLLSVGAAVVGVIRDAWGRPPSKPLNTADLVVLAGAWAALISIYLTIDRPDEVAGSTHVSLHWGIFVALGGCILIVAAGMRMRAERSPAG